MPGAVATSGKPLRAIGPGSSVHFLGIAGLAMSGLACIAKDRGFRVTGSDVDAYPPTTTHLADAGIEWQVGHAAANVVDPDLVVLGNHVRPGNPELEAVLARQLPMVSFPEFVRYLFPEKILRIVPAGTHGKSTITSMLAWLLVGAEMDPTVLLGAVSQDLGTSFRVGRGRYLVVEGDEYTSSCLDETPKFMYYDPTYAVITTAELDHVDRYASQAEQVEAFAAFAAAVADGGVVLLCGASPELAALPRDRLRAAVRTYGLDGDFDWTAADLRPTATGSRFAATPRAGDAFPVEVGLAGRHNVENSLAAIGIAREIGLPVPEIQRSLRTFTGVSRRFDVVHDDSSRITVVDDYAHHPSAVRVTVRSALEKYAGHRLWCVFEPHTYSRTRALLADYPGAFAGAQRVLVTDVYSAREAAADATVHARDVVKALAHDGVAATHTPGPEAILALLDAELAAGDVVLVMSVSGLKGLAAAIAARFG